MNVMRMVKLFGWEPKMRQRIAEKREDELNWIWRQNVLDVVNDVVKCVTQICPRDPLSTYSSFFPIIVMISTFATYVSFPIRLLSQSDLLHRR